MHQGENEYSSESEGICSMLWWGHPGNGQALHDWENVFDEVRSYNGGS